MPRESTDACLRENLLDEVIASYLDAVALGRPPRQQELLARFPELAAELTKFFEDRDQFDLLASPLREFAGRSTRPEKQPAVRVDPGPRPSPTPGVADSRTLTFPPRAVVGEESSLPTLADYEILEELGRGGMGVVYKAWQRSLKRLVALKMLLVGGGTTPDELERFRTEAEVVARLEHPNIVRIHEVGRQGDVPFLSLEFVEGGSLNKQLAGSPLPARPAAQLVEVLARAIHFAHQRSVVHRDLKPANILLGCRPSALGTRPEDEEGATLADLFEPIAEGRQPMAVKITDFGLAKRLDGDSGQTRSGTVLGTPSYMAPEQAQGHNKAVGPAADVWALGAILYELLTGRPPFRAPTPMNTLFQVLQDEPVPPARLQPTCPRDLEIICLKCLQKESHKRYASAEELADDLRRFLNGETIRARPAGVWERSLKWARRHPAVAALVAVSSLAVLALAVGMAVHVNALRVTAEEARAGERKARKEKDQITQGALRVKYVPQLKQARDALLPEGVGGKQLDTAEIFALKVREAVRDDPSLTDLKVEAEGVLNEVGRLREARKNYQSLFLKLDDALFQLNRHLFTGLDGAESLAAARETAEEAITPFRVKSEAEVGQVLDDCYSGSEKERIILSCYHALLIQADALARPSLVRPDEKQRASVDPDALRRALRILERANKLVPPAQVYLACRLRRARCLELLNKRTEARKERALAGGRQPVDAFDAFLVGSDKWLEGQKPQEALRDLEGALRGDKDLFWARLFLAVGLKQSQRERAVANLTICIDRRPDFIWGYLIRGFIHGERFDFESAEADFAKAWQLHQRNPDRSAEYVLLVNRGVMRIRQHRYEEAVKDLKKAVALRPDQFQGHLNLGVAYREQRKWDEAARLLATSLQPGRLSAVLGMSVSGQDRGQWDEAVLQLGEAIRLKPDLAMLYRERALLHLLRKDRRAALADFQKAIEIERARRRLWAIVPSGSETHKDYLECGLIHYQEQRYEKAVRACDSALTLQPGYARAHRVRAEAFLARAEKEVPRASKQQLYREARLSFDRYLVYGLPSVEVFQGRALVHEGLGNYPAVVGEYSHALALRPRDPALLAARGWAYIAVEDWKRARDNFTQAIGLDPTNAQAHNGQGYALVKLGQAIEGVREARKALELGPPTRRLFYNAARVFAQASAVEAEAEQSSRGWGGRSDAYREEAVRCLEQALALLEKERPAEFWQKVVRPDRQRRGGALYPLHRSLRFADLAERYDRPVGGRPQGN